MIQAVSSVVQVQLASEVQEGNHQSKKTTCAENAHLLDLAVALLDLTVTLIDLTVTLIDFSLVFFSWTFALLVSIGIAQCHIGIT
jgi:hypothetical protein